MAGPTIAKDLARLGPAPDLLVYLDANVTIKDPRFIEDLVKDHEEHKWALLMTRHEQRTAAIDEIAECRSVMKYSHEGLDIQAALVGPRDAPANQECLHWCGFNAFWATGPEASRVAECMADWWAAIRLDPYGRCNDQVVWPWALARAKATGRPFRFRSWEPEYLLFKRFDFELNANHAASRKPLWPLTTVVKSSLFGGSTGVKKRPHRPLTIVVLCHDAASLSLAESRFAHFWWAEPVCHEVLGANNPLFETLALVRYKELLEPYWGSSEYVGLLSYKATEKINVRALHDAIERGNYRNFDYVTLSAVDNTIEGSKFVQSHPHFLEIWRDALEPLVGPATAVKECFYNYWLGTRDFFKRYCEFVAQEALPRASRHPLIMSDAKYVDGRMTPEQLVKLCGVPWYPHLPFIFERLSRPYAKSRSGVRCGKLVFKKVTEAPENFKALGLDIDRSGLLAGTGGCTEGRSSAGDRCGTEGPLK